MDWKAPKSLRQIGKINGKTKIYVEDYVMSFARRLSKERGGMELGGVLLGHRFYHAGEKVFLVSGMVSIKDFYLRESDTFSQEMWTGIYTDIKENFTDLDVVGWCYSGGGNSGDGSEEQLLEIHRRNFSEGDKLLYIYEENSSKDDFFLYENSRFVKQDGYYVYYEKNPEMRQYMMEEANRFRHIVEQEDDRVLRNIRGVIRENEEKKKTREEEGKWTYMLAGLVVALGLALGVVAIGSKSGLDELKNQINGLQTILMGTQEEETTVETVGSGIVSSAAVSGASASAVEASGNAVSESATEGLSENSN
jgi:hypothetical protein